MSIDRRMLIKCLMLELQSRDLVTKPLSMGTKIDLVLLLRKRVQWWMHQYQHSLVVELELVSISMMERHMPLFRVVQLIRWIGFSF